MTRRDATTTMMSNWQEYNGKEDDDGKLNIYDDNDYNNDSSDSSTNTAEMIQEFLASEKDAIVLSSTSTTTTTSICTCSGNTNETQRNRRRRQKQRKQQNQKQSDNNTNKKKKKKKNKKHRPNSLDSMRQRVSELMSLFEENGWFIPLPSSAPSFKTSDDDNHKEEKEEDNESVYTNSTIMTTTTTTNNNTNGTKGTKGKKGKVWSSRIYGADKKRQRKNVERQVILDRIQQLERCLVEEHGMENIF